jgi:hypothetical protein
MFEEVDSVIFDGTIIERANGDDSELGAGFLFKFGAKSFQPLAGAGGDYAGKIGDVPGGRDSLDVVRERGSERKHKRKCIDGKPQQAGTVCGGQNRFQISASLRIWWWATDKHRGF